MPHRAAHRSWARAVLPHSTVINLGNAEKRGAMSDLNIFACGLLDFAEQSIEQGLQDQASLLEYLNEADSALRILRKRLEQHDARVAQLVAPVIDHDGNF